MAKVKTNTNASGAKRARRPAMTPEARENQLISYAIDLVEQRLLDGTASSQETTHFLKLASSKAKLEKKMLEKQVDLLVAKTEALQSEKHRDELYVAAIEAMRRYSGNGGDEDYEDD